MKYILKLSIILNIVLTNEVNFAMKPNEIISRKNKTTKKLPMSLKRFEADIKKLCEEKKWNEAESLLKNTTKGLVKKIKKNNHSLLERDKISLFSECIRYLEGTIYREKGDLKKAYNCFKDVSLSLHNNEYREKSKKELKEIQRITGVSQIFTCLTEIALESSLILGQSFH